MRLIENQISQIIYMRVIKDWISVLREQHLQKNNNKKVKISVC